MRVEAEPAGRGGCPGSWPLLERPLEFEHAKTAETACRVIFFLSIRRSVTQVLNWTERKHWTERKLSATFNGIRVFVDPKYARARRSSPLRAPRRSNRTAAGVCAPCPLRRSLLAFGSTPASRATRTPGTGTHGRVVATSSQLRATRSAV